MARLRQVVRHELMHVFVWLVQLRRAALEGPRHMWYLDTWFSEGLSECVWGASRQAGDRVSPRCASVT
jgi:hypothetical protein